MNIRNRGLLSLLSFVLLTFGCAGGGSVGETPDQSGDSLEVRQDEDVKADVWADSSGLPETGGDGAGAVLPDVVLSPGVIDFNEVGMGHQSTQSLWVMNKGGADHRTHPNSDEYRECATTGDRAGPGV
jgi:hypothetical protein